jgi:hypothetical protein
MSLFILNNSLTSHTALPNLNSQYDIVKYPTDCIPDCERAYVWHNPDTHTHTQLSDDYS